MSCTYLWPDVSGSYGRIFLLILTSLSILTSVPGNIITGYVILKTEVLRSEPSYLLIFTVCLADALVSCVTQPLYMATLLLGTRTSCYLDNIYCSIAWFSSSASMMGIVAITTDRYLFIVYPLHYAMYMTQKRAIIIIIFIWLSALLSGTLPLITNNSLIPQSGVLFSMIIIMIAMVYMYRKVFKTVSSASTAPVHHTNERERKSIPKKYQATKTVMLIVLTFIGCWFPWVAVSFVVALHETVSSLSPFDGSSLVIKFYWISLAIVYCNSSLDVLIYSRKNTVVQREVTKYFRQVRLCIANKLGRTPPTTNSNNPSYNLSNISYNGMAITLPKQSMSTME